MKRLLTIALSALFAIHAVEARTLYVNASRPNNKGSGLSLKTAKKTIQAAVKIAKKGDTILVYPGTYAPIKTNNKKITIKSVKGKGKTKIVKPKKDGQVVALVSLGKSLGYEYEPSSGLQIASIKTKGSKSTLTGFLIDGMNRALGSYGRVIGITGGKAESCIIQNIGRKYIASDGWKPGHDDSTVVDGSSLTDCTLKNNKAYTFVAPGGTVTARTKFLRCKIVGNDCDSGIGNGSVLYNCLVIANTFVDEALTGSTLVNCTVSDNVVDQWDWSRYGSDPDPMLFSSSTKYYNCVLWNNYVRPTDEVEYVQYCDSEDRYIGYRQGGSETCYIIVPDDEYGTKEVPMTEAEIEQYYPGYTVWDRDTEQVPGTKKVIHNVDAGNTYKNTDKTNKNPKFANAAKGNYKLKKGSYAINSGKLTASQKKLVGTKDLAGKKRIRGKAIDRGCYEY